MGQTATTIPSDSSAIAHKQTGASSKRSGLLFKVDWPIGAVGGVNEVVLSLASEAEKSGYQPLIAASQAEPVPVRGIRVTSLHLRSPITDDGVLKPLLAFLLTLPASVNRTRSLLKSWNIRLINAHFPDLDIYTFLVMQRLKLHKGKVILSFHGADITKLQGTRGIAKLLWRYLIRHVDGVTVCSEALRRELLAFAPGAQATTIHNGADISMFHCPKLKRKRGHTLLSVGKFERKKGHDVLLQAFSNLRETIRDARLWLVGAAGPELERTQVEIHRLGLESCIEVSVDVPHEEMPAIFSKADAFVLPSRSEPFGIVLIEAAAAGLPVVASNVGGIPELIENEVTGLLVKPDDPEMLQRAIERVFSDDEVAERLAKSWHETAIAQFTWNSAFSRLVKLAGI